MPMLAKRLAQGISTCGLAPCGWGEAQNEIQVVKGLVSAKLPCLIGRAKAKAGAVWW